MTIEKTKLDGVLLINNFNAVDDRGIFVKTFNKKMFLDNNIDFEIKESYYSISNKDVIRGMHFQMPPNDHKKLVYVTKGAIIDVIVDLRKESKTFMQSISVELSSFNRKSVFIPKGLAHGFKSLEKDTFTVYNVGTEYAPESDMGIKFNSFGFDWGLKKPIISERDLNFLSMSDFNTINPF